MKVRYTWHEVPGVEPALRTRSFRRAQRRRDKLNARRGVPWYRWEVMRSEDDRRWEVVALQNQGMS